MSESDDFFENKTSDTPKSAEEIMWDHLNKFGVEDKDKELDNEEAQGSFKKVKKQAIKARKPVYAQDIEADLEIDLHGQTADESEFLFEQALKEAQIRKLKTIRFIHGGHLGHYGPVKTKLDFLINRVYKSIIRSSRLDSHNDGATLVEFVKFD